MLSKCLNPQCHATFHHLGQGHLYRIDFTEEAKRRAMEGKPVLVSTRNKVNTVEHFWLCEKCSISLTIGVSESFEVRLLPLTHTKPAASAVMHFPQKLAATAS
jgi:hypothetical protein